jgi:preprotein translocase subunit SecA
MLEKILRKLFGDKASQELKRYDPLVDEINTIYAGLSDYEDDQLRDRYLRSKSVIAAKLTPLGCIGVLERDYREETMT